MSRIAQLSRSRRLAKSSNVIDFVSTGTFALVVGMTLVQFLLPTVPAPMADAVTLSTAKGIVGCSIAALIVPFAYLTVRMVSEFINWLGPNLPVLQGSKR